MAADEPLSGGSTGGETSVDAADALTDGGRLRARKIVVSVLSAFVVTIAGSVLSVVELIVTWQTRAISGLGEFLALVLERVALEGLSASIAARTTALEAAVDVSPVLAPAILTAEVLGIIAIVSFIARRTPYLPEVGL